MTLSTTDKETLLQSLENSSLDADIKAKLKGILSVEPVSQETLDEAVQAIQASLDEDIAAVPGLAEDIAADPEYQALVESNERELANIEAQVEKATAVFDKGSAELDKALDALSEEDTEDRLAVIKGNLNIPE